MVRDENGKLKEKTVSGLRTRFNPRSRIGQGLVSVAPWVDVVLLLVLFLVIAFRSVLQPGFVVHLPEASFEQGSQLGMIAFILSVGDADSVQKKEIVFFDDERFVVGDDEQMERLRSKFSAHLPKDPEAVLTVQADQYIRHGTIVNIIQMARETGCQNVNVGVRTF